MMDLLFYVRPNYHRSATGLYITVTKSLFTSSLRDKSSIVVSHDFFVIYSV